MTLLQGSASLQVSTTTIYGNTATYNGGGIYSDASSSGNASLTISSSALSANSANNGGGVLNDGFDNGIAVLTVSNSTFNDNLAVSNGGGIYNHGFTGSASLTLDNSTFSGNSANSYGGGIYNGEWEGTSALSLASVQTLDGRIVTDAGGSGDSTLEIRNTTFFRNSAPLGGCIYNVLGQAGEAIVSLGNTILKTGALGGNIFNDSGTVSSLGYNLSSDSCGGFLTGPGDHTNTEPMLGPLQDNGGPTLTHGLLPSSPAINAGDPSFAPPPFYDQRGPGFDRVMNGRIDIGAFEVQARTPIPRPRPSPGPRPTPR